MRRAIFWLHLVLGLALSLYLAVIGITGSILAFHEELEPWFEPELHQAPSPTLGDLPPAHCLPPPAISIVAKLDVFLAESPKTARAFLKRAYADAGIDRTLTAITIHELSNSTPEEHLREWLADPRDIGVVSEAGAPGIADPGANVVRVAHTVGRTVHPLVGPSSITLALMASGLGGQHFEFRGYLPVKTYSSHHFVHAGLARAVDDPALSKEILDSVREDLSAL